MSQDFLPLLGTDHIEFWVGNAKQAAYYYQKAFGFELVAYAGPETGIRDRASYVLQQGKIRFILTTAMQPDTEIAKHVMKHGDREKVIAVLVHDAEKSFYETMSRGASSILDGAYAPMKRSSLLLRRVPPSPRQASVIKMPLGMSPVGWNWMNSISLSVRPARYAIASPSPVTVSE